MDDLIVEMTASLQEQEDGHEPVGAHGASIARKPVVPCPV
jgi:hypothetical protein